MDSGKNDQMNDLIDRYVYSIWSTYTLSHNYVAWSFFEIITKILYQ